MGRTGSSPLTRGKPIEGALNPSVGRLIPAHAGKTENGGKAWNKATAHPRSRGENSAGPPSPARSRGSSPLTRGKRRLWALPSLAFRLIPAHAGKTSDQRSDSDGRQAHPRSRGENSWLSSTVANVGGSSPLTRGKRTVIKNQGLFDGLIPAHAGKTCQQRGGARQRGAHPRSRGENRKRLRS